MRVEVADRAVELAADLDGRELIGLALEPVDEVRELLAERRRRRGLAVRAREHRDVGELVRVCAQLRRELLHHGQQHALARVAQHQRVREVVDVLRRAREMQERDQVFRRAREALELVPQVVLDGLDVVVRDGLERLHALRVLDAEVVDDLVEHVLQRRVERLELGERRLVREMLEPAHLDQGAIADQRVLG